MATRIYFPSSGAIPSGASNPTVGTWTETTGFDRLGASTSRGATAMTNKTRSRTAAAANNTWLDRMYVIGPLAAQTFGATTVKGSIRALESAANDNVDAMRLLIRIVAPDGTTFRGTVYGPTNSTVAEFNTSLRSKRLATGGATTSVAATEGDYLVVEIGATTTAGGTSISTSINYGDNSATDLADTELDTAANNPFIEFAANMKFLGRGFGQAQAYIKRTDRGYGQALAHISGIALITDTFTRSVSNNWGTADSGGTWVVTTTPTDFSVAGNTGFYSSSTSDDIALYRSELYLLEGLYTVRWNNLTSGTEIGFKHRLGTGSTDGVEFRLLVSAAGAVTPRVSLTQNGSTVSEDGSNFSYTVSFFGVTVRYQILNNADNTKVLVRAKIWQENSTEPDWQFSSIHGTALINTLKQGGNTKVFLDTKGSSKGFFVDNISIKPMILAGFGQAKADIKQTYNAFAQAQASISVVSTVLAQAQAQAVIQSSVSAIGQAQALVAGAFTSVLDTFTRSVSDDLGTADVGGAYTYVQGTASNADVNGSAAIITAADSMAYNLNSVIHPNNVEVFIQVSLSALPTSGNAGITIKGFRGSSDGLGIGRNLVLFSITSGAVIGVGSNGVNAVNGTYTPGDVWNIRAQNFILAQSNNLTRVKLWKAGDVEPGWSVGTSNGDPADTIGGNIQFIFAAIAGNRTWTIDNLQISQASRSDYGQAQASIKAIDVEGFGQAQAKINAFDVDGFGQAQADILQTYQGYAQSQAEIKQTYNGYGQAQACIKGNAFGQSQADIKQIYRGYGQSQACVKGNAFGQAKADILQTYQGYSQSQARIKAVYQGYGQAQPYIRPRVGLGQARALLNTGFGTANAQSLITYGIISVLDTFTRVVGAGTPGTADVGGDWASLSGTATQFTVDGSVLKYQGISSANTIQYLYQEINPGPITRLSIDFIVHTWNSSGTLGVNLLAHTNRTNLNSHPVIGIQRLATGEIFLNVLNNGTSLGIDYIVLDTWYTFIGEVFLPGDGRRSARVKLFIRGSSEPGWSNLASGTATSAYMPGNTGLEIRPATTGVNIDFDNLSANQSGWTDYGQAQARIKQVYQGYGQSQADIKAVSRVYGQAQADILQTYNGFGQAQAKIEVALATYDAYGQAQACIKGNAFAQSQADILQVYQGYGQALAKIAGHVIYLRDTFTRTESGQFGIPDIGSAYITVSNSNGIISVDGSEGVYTGGTDPSETRIANNINAYNFDLYSEFTFNGSADFMLISFELRAHNLATAYETGVVFIFSTPPTDPDHLNAQLVYINTDPSFSDSDTFFHMERDIKYSIKIRVLNEDIQTKVWKTGDIEPDWMISLGGLVGQSAGQLIIYPQIYGYVTPASITLDNINVEDITDSVFAQAQGAILQAYNSFAQSQAWIEQTYNGYGQAQACIKGNGFGQAQADIKSTYQAYAQSQADIKTTYFGFAQANADIKATINRCAQAQAEIKQTYNGYGQSQADIKQTYNGFGQAQGEIKQTYQAYSQAQADIKVTTNRFAQSQADIKAIYIVCAQAQADIKQTYNVHAQAQALIVVRDIEAFAQAQADIKVITNCHGQAQADIKATYQSYAQSQADIKAVSNVYSQAQADIKTTYQAYAQAQAQITQTYQAYAQSQADIKATYQAYAQAQAKINAFDFNQYGQAQASIRFNGTVGCGQAQAKINAFNYPQWGQACADIKATSNGYGQANADIKQTYNSFAQAQADILATYQGYGQAQSDIKATYQGYGQCQAHIIVRDVEGFGQAQADILTTYQGYANAQADIKQTYQAYAQAQGQIKQAYQAYGQSQALIVVTDIEGLGQAQGTILQTYYGFGQSQGTIKATSNGYGQASCNILGAKLVYAQSQADIKAVGYGFGQSQADIKTTYQAYGQCQAQIKRTFQSYAQANALIITTAQGYGQTNADIKATINSCGQAQADIKTTYNKHGQAQGQIKQTYQSYGQAQAYILILRQGSGQAQADIKVTSRGSGNAQADILAISTRCANAQALISTNVIKIAQSQALIKVISITNGQAQATITSGTAGYGQTQALIYRTEIKTGQAQSLIIKAAGYGQARAVILQLHQLKKLRISDRILPRLRLSDRPSVSISATDRDSSMISISDDSITTLSISDRASISLTISDIEY